MASFAKIGINNIVEHVISINNNELLENNIELEEKGIQFCKFLYGQETNWKQTSYNTVGGIHKLGKIPFRKNHASIGFIYDENRDAFIAPKPFNSWILNEDTCLWEAPVAKPTITTYDDGMICTPYWDEDNIKWISKDHQQNIFVWIPESLSWILKNS
jgi:hypothetical protein